jgi:septum formation protein
MKKKILLASGSARRKELMTQLGYEFEVVTADCDELYPEDLPADQVAPFLSELKAKSFAAVGADEILNTADTVVVLDRQVLGKPRSREEALVMLQSLSGKMHQVYTAITVRSGKTSITEVDVANVFFDTITENEAVMYVDRYQPMDKAGSYGIQEWLGMARITRIEGSFYTIMGLPTHLLYKTLQKLM